MKKANATNATAQAVSVADKGNKETNVPAVAVPAVKPAKIGFVREAMISMGFYVFPKGEKPTVEICPAFTASERKTAKSSVLVLESAKGSLARSVLVLGDRIALSRCPSTGLEVLIGLEASCHDLPTLKIASARLMSEEDFAKSGTTCAFKRNGAEAQAIVLGYDKAVKPADYLAARHTSGKAIWYGQIESRSLPNNHRELAQGIKAVTIAPKTEKSKAAKARA